MAYADYTFYTDVYKGDMGAEEFERWAARAGLHIDRYTSGRAAGAPESMKRALSLCCCGSASELLPQLGALSPNRLFVSPEADWEFDFTPWPAPTLQGGRPFADGSVLGGAPTFLRWVEGELLPALAAQFALNPAQNSVFVRVGSTWRQADNVMAPAY